LIAATQYCYTVVAYDSMENESAPTNQTCATTAAVDDTEDPTVPTGLIVAGYTSSQIDLSWNASSDNVGVAGYKIYQNGIEFDSSTTLSYSDMGLSPETEYCYAVAAYDAAGNLSAPGEEACVTTLVVSIWYRDADDDGYGDINDSQSADSQPSGYVSNHTDCNDNDASVHPGAAEVCDGLDNNCNESIDEGLLATFYEDQDGDGFGNAGSTVDACTQPTGYVTNGDDCNDGAQNSFPGGTEICNDGLDNDCNGLVDDAYADVPQPELILTNSFTGNGWEYDLEIANATEFPQELFVLSTAYPACDANESDGSRTVLQVYDSDGSLLSDEWCAFSSPEDLSAFYVYDFSGATNPEAIYITLYDWECGITWTSNLTVVVPPVQVWPGDGTFFTIPNPGSTTLEWQAVAGAVSYTVEARYHDVLGPTPLGVYTGITTTSYGLAFPYLNGSWRVWAVDSLGNSGPVSDWWYFSYQ